MRTYLAHRAPILLDRPHTAPQGRVSQGWPLRTHSPEWTVAEDKRAPMSPAEAWLLMVIYLLSTCFAAWVFCAFAAWVAR